MRIMIILATVLSIIPIITSCFMPNWYLGDKQNAVDDSSIDENSEIEHYEHEDSDEDDDETVIEPGTLGWTPRTDTRNGGDGRSSDCGS